MIALIHSFRPVDWLQPTTSLPSTPAVASVASPNRDEKFVSTLDYFGIVHHQHANGLLKSNCQCNNIKSLDLAPVAVLHDNTNKAGGKLSLYSVTHSTQFVLPHEFKGQAFTPNDSFSSGGSGRMVPIATNTTTNITQLQIAASDRLPAYDTPVPLIYNLIPEASQVPSDSKYEKQICMT